MIIICDSHEPKDIQEQLKRKFPNIGVSELGVSSGDLFVQLSNGILIIERKTPADFVASIADHRLFDQAEMIPTLARFPVVIIDGEFMFDSKDFMMTARPGQGWVASGWTHEAIEMAKMHVQAEGMIVVESLGLDYADRVERVIDWCENKADRGHAYRKVRLTLNPFEDVREQRCIDFMSSLPGVGYDRAKNLFDFCKRDARLIDLLLYALHFDAKAKDRPKLWGNDTKKKLRELFELQENETLRIERTEQHEHNA